MAAPLIPAFRTAKETLLIGTMAIYDTQADLSERVPHQWREFRLSHPAPGTNCEFYGASPCTNDRKIHYLTGIALKGQDDSIHGDRLTLEAGEYAVVRVEDAARLRDTWIWMLRTWLPASGRLEKKAPEFERFTDISESGLPVGTRRNLDPSRTA